MCHGILDPEGRTGVSSYATDGIFPLPSVDISPIHRTKKTAVAGLGRSSVLHQRIRKENLARARRACSRLANAATGHTSTDSKKFAQYPIQLWGPA